MRRAELVANSHFLFLNKELCIPQIDWNRRYLSQLWNFNLHYFDYALDLAWAFRQTSNPSFVKCYRFLLDDWISKCEVGKGDGWHPYPLSLRVVNWMYSLSLLRDALSPSFASKVERSIYLQLLYLEKRLERDVQANHLLKNLKALVLGGVLFSGQKAREWAESGGQALWSEIDEQVLPDGGHFERSPMYHAMVLLDLLEVKGIFRASGRTVPTRILEKTSRMACAFLRLSRPDGTLRLLNDSADGIAPDGKELILFAEKMTGHRLARECGPWALHETGYFGWSDLKTGERFIVDCAPPGPSYQPGHAHCDLLSFELDLHGSPLVVDSGVSGYADDPYREFVRSTRAHNTVMIGEREQSEIWHVFRMGRRARVVRAEQSVNQSEYCFSGAYSPYFDRQVLHERKITRDREGWIVTDRVKGARDAVLDSFLHLHPDVSVMSRGAEVLVRCRDLSVRILPFAVDDIALIKGQMQPVQGWYCPEFGRALPAVAIQLRVSKNDHRDFGYRIQVDHTE